MPALLRSYSPRGFKLWWPVLIYARLRAKWNGVSLDKHTHSKHGEFRAGRDSRNARLRHCRVVRWCESYPPQRSSDR